jgi:nitroimidazol reductase NimA-like FMN-containing flavoprotein (pyridoxamine 5'-phosphate oxidase superfamily)
MRKTNQEITDWNVLEEILSGAHICRLAMMDGDQPYLLPFNYGYRDRTIYIHSAPEGKKIELLRKNQRVCFEIENGVKIIEGENPCDWSTRFRSVLGYGTVEIITDEQGKQEGLEVIMAHHGVPDQKSFSMESLHRMVILKLTIDSVTGKKSGNWNRYPLE